MAKSAAATTTKIEPSPETGPRKIPMVEASQVFIDHAGQRTRSLFIGLPAGAIVDDVKTPGIFKTVQAGSKALRKFDRVLLVAFDESFAVDAVVTHSTLEGATLSGIKIVSMPDRQMVLPQTELFRVEYVGNGMFAVVRKSDGSQVTSAVASQMVAEREMFLQHERRR